MKHSHFIEKLNIIIEDLSKDEIQELSEFMNVKLQQLASLTFDDSICTQCHDICNTHTLVETDTSEHFGIIAETSDQYTVSTCHNERVV